MKYDVYAEFWMGKELDEKFRKWVEDKWMNVVRNKKVDWNKKPRELRKELESDIEFFHDLATTFLHNNEGLCPVLYAKIQKIIQCYVQAQRRDLINFIHSTLSGQVRGYGRSRSLIDRLDLKELPREAYKEFIRQFRYHEEILRLVQMVKHSFNMQDDLRKYMVLLEIKFTLRKPYISKDDENFYIIDNPVCKDRVFKVPCIRSTTWKGVLRWISYKLFISKLESGNINENNWKEERDKLVRLFGKEKDRLESYVDIIVAEKLGKEVNEVRREFQEYLKNNYNVKNGREGRLIFFTSLLDGISLDVITPLDRIRRSPVRGPILIETTPEGAKGKFTLLYVPFDLIERLSSEKIEDQQQALKEIKEDLELLKESAPKMMLEYGFSAKKTSGYGVIEDEIEFWINGEHYKGSFDDFRREMDKLISKVGG